MRILVIMIAMRGRRQIKKDSENIDDAAGFGSYNVNDTDNRSDDKVAADYDDVDDENDNDDGDDEDGDDGDDLADDGVDDVCSCWCL